MPSSIARSCFLVFILATVRGQLSVDELFQFTSQHTAVGDCTDFQYAFTDLKVQYHKYNQLRFDCRSSSLVLRNSDDAPSSICPADEAYLHNFRIHFPDTRLTSIEVNELRLHGIELSSLDEQIRLVYDEHGSYRSRWGLLINLISDKSTEEHVAIANDGEMTFVLFLLPTNSNSSLLGSQIELIFPNGQTFQFNQSANHVWRIDQGYVRNPRTFENILQYQLAKTTFSLFGNETFFIYGTQFSSVRRFIVEIDGTRASCKYDYILQCNFPILPLHIRDDHEPNLRLLYSFEEVFNATLQLHPRTRLHHIPTNSSLTSMETFEVTIPDKICGNHSLKSRFSFIVHLWKEDDNGAAKYTYAKKDDLFPMDCNSTASIGREIRKAVGPLSLDDVISLDVDLTHQWHDQRDCRIERTRISFV